MRAAPLNRSNDVGNYRLHPRTTAAIICGPDEFDSDENGHPNRCASQNFVFFGHLSLDLILLIVVDLSFRLESCLHRTESEL